MRLASFHVPNHRIAVMGRQAARRVLDIIQRDAAAKRGEGRDEQKLQMMKAMTEGIIDKESDPYFATARCGTTASSTRVTRARVATRCRRRTRRPVAARRRGECSGIEWRIDKILIANRGECGARMRTAAQHGHRDGRGVFDADALAPFVRFADEAVRIGPPAARESYLVINAISTLHARRAPCDSPAYGSSARTRASRRR